ncbi:hypothetical protein CK203_081579 [Vitis vinifera]|uniref:Heavy metal-associated isoprenylated plant protein 39 n=1 Tax=Vitis vinifera TaxID=29760 RepID=A0A438E2D9_VITVI|nr:hypothetical protein CK203_081579 [Vitis vinifera]
MDMKDKKLTVIGDVDPVSIVGRLRKLCHAEILSIGPAKEPEKKEEPRKRSPRNKNIKKTLKINWLILLKHTKLIILTIPHTILFEVWKKTRMLVSFVNHQIIEESKKAKAIVSVCG